MNPEELLSHADFVRSLARSLVSDENLADDLSQDACAVALTHPPATGNALRGWFRKVLLNFTRKHFRGEQRLRARERASAFDAAEAAPSADAIAAREEIRGMVVQAVQSLDEPWRSTILLRYYGNLHNRQVAERLGVPLETVRTRLKKGLKLLRERLDRMHHGDRDDWRLALAPLAGLEASLATSGVPAGATSGLLSGTASVLLLGAKLKVAAATILALLILVAAWQLFPDRGGPGIGGAAESDLEAGGDGIRSPEPGGIDEETAHEIEKVAPDSRDVTWQGRLIDYDGLPAAGAVIEISPVRRRDSSTTPVVPEPVRSSETGHFEFAGIETGTYAVTLSFSPALYRLDRYEWGELTFEDPGLVERDILVAEGRGAIVAGVVIDEETGQPISLPPRKPQAGPKDTYIALLDPEDQGQARPADVDRETGRFCFRGLSRKKFEGTCLLIGFFRKIGLTPVDTTERKIIDDLEITAPPFGMIRILFAGLSGKEIRSIDINLESDWGIDLGMARLFAPDTALPIPAGKGCFHFTHPELGTASRSFELRRGETVEIALSPGDFTTGDPDEVNVPFTLVSRNGAPLGGATLALHKKLEYLPRFKNLDHSGVTDSRGRLTLENVKPGIWSAWCAPGYDDMKALFERIMRLHRADDSFQIAAFHGITVPARAEPGFSIDLIYPTGVVRGTLCNAETGLPIEPIDRRFRSSVILALDEVVRFRGLCSASLGREFEFSGLPGGDYQFAFAAFGFDQVSSDVVTLEEGQVLDLGRIMLRPMGTMEIEVRNPAGELLKFRAGWDGKKGGHSVLGVDGQRLEPGRTCFGRLPEGPLDVTITARKFKPQTITLEISTTRMVKAKVVLEPE